MKASDYENSLMILKVACNMSVIARKMFTITFKCLNNVFFPILLSFKGSNFEGKLQLPFFVATLSNLLQR